MRPIASLVLLLLAAVCPLFAQENTLEQEASPWTDGWIKGAGFRFGGELPGEVLEDHMYLTSLQLELIRPFRIREEGWLEKIDFVNFLNIGFTASPAIKPVVGGGGSFRFHFDPLDFKPFKRTTVFLEVGGGMNYFTAHKSVDRITGAFQFAAVAGAGVTYYSRRFPNRAFVIGYAIRHHSNLSSLLPTPKPNQGVNTHEIYLEIQSLPKKK